ncbi:TRP75-related protein [Wolbachia endosymbiont of Pentidionis agamae]|uniref:TRP75-related protein n=1 Tax=Wolbachia endosymbiont of Pentidionis agamae TaxID=3110435 RepID=UPI002FCFF227
MVFNALFTVLLTVLSFTQSVEGKVSLSKRQPPAFNPGGTNFYEDEEFVKAYELYKKRRNSLKKKNLQNKIVNKNNLQNKPKQQKNKAALHPAYNKENDSENAMINQYGIDIARIKGARFIDTTKTTEQFTRIKEGFNDDTKVEEKKVRKMMCSYDFITTDKQENSVQNVEQNTKISSSDEVSSFESVVDND